MPVDIRAIEQRLVPGSREPPRVEGGGGSQPGESHLPLKKFYRDLFFLLLSFFLFPCMCIF